MSASQICFGLPGEGLRDALWERYQTLLAQGVPSDQILVLVESPTRTAWNERLKTLVPTGTLRVHTPDAWIKRELETWWPAVDAALSETFPSEQTSPVFVEVDLAQHLMGSFREDLDLLAGARTPPSLQNGQMLDALARSIENDQTLLPLGPDSTRRLAASIADRLKEGNPKNPLLLDQVGTAIHRYLDGMLSRRILDYALRLELFTAVLWKDPGYRAHLQAATLYLLVENLDESNPRLQGIYRNFCDFCEGFLTLQADPKGHFQGGLREYVGADPDGAWKFVKTLSGKGLAADDPPLAPLGRALHDSLVGELRRVRVPEERLYRKLDCVAYSEMLDAVSGKLRNLLKQGKPSEIALVVPSLDPLLIWALRGQIERLGVPLYIFAGTNRLSDYRPVRLLLTLAKLAFPQWEAVPSRFERIELLEFVTGLNPLQIGRATETDMREWESYQALEQWLGEPHEDLVRFFREAFARVYAPHAHAAARIEEREARQREISQIGQLIELTEGFQTLEARRGGEKDWGERFLAFLQENPISERPFFKREPHHNSLMLSTPNQLADMGFRGGDSIKHLFLLDWGSERWWKSEKKELSHARVLSHRWKGGPYTVDDEKKDTDEKLGRMLLACLLKPTEKAWIFGSLADPE
ncbi:MAG: hypothetical protein ACM3YO_06750, partial [Bacteroidota bacterium]